MIRQENRWDCLAVAAVFVVVLGFEFGIKITIKITIKNTIRTQFGAVGEQAGGLFYRCRSRGYPYTDRRREFTRQPRITILCCPALQNLNLSLNRQLPPQQLIHPNANIIKSHQSFADQHRLNIGRDQIFDIATCADTAFTHQ